ncbi:MAG: PH domain-containing protein [Pseudomonadota bacterium]
MKDEQVIAEAEFNPAVKTYWLLSGAVIFVVTIIGIPLLIFWFAIGLWATGRYLANMSATLTTRRLIVKRGIFVRVEKTVPLDKITDLGMVEGPIMRALNVQKLTVETAGQSGAGALVGLTGVIDAQGFREKTLAARDAMIESAAPAATPAEAPAATDDRVVALLGTISASLQRIEERLGRD